MPPFGIVRCRPKIAVDGLQNWLIMQAGPRKRIVAMVGKWAAGAKILIVPLLVTFARGTESLTGTAMSGELRCGRASAVNRMCFACACLI